MNRSSYSFLLFSYFFELFSSFPKLWLTDLKGIEADNAQRMFMIQHSRIYLKYMEFSSGFSKNSYEVHICAKENHTMMERAAIQLITDITWTAISTDFH